MTTRTNSVGGVMMLLFQATLLSTNNFFRAINAFVPPSRSFAKQPKRFHRPKHLRFAKTSDGTLEPLYRADRVLANRSGKSRTECHQLLKQKRVFQLIDGQPTIVQGPSDRLTMKAPIMIDKKLVPLPPPLLMVYHKPKWILSVRSDPQERPCVKDVLPNLHPVGRLDYDTSGLLLFSSSGALTQTLLHPKHEIEKEYQAVVTGTVLETELRQQLAEGVDTSHGTHTAQLLQVVHWEPSSIRPYLQDIRANLPSQYNQTNLELRGYLKVFDATALSTLRLTVAEGKYRMVRKLLANCGHPVVSLERVRLGMITLGPLMEGQVRELTSDEEKWAESLLKQGKQRTNKNEEDESIIE